MKTKILLTLLTLFAIFKTNAQCTGNVNIPDANFKQDLLDNTSINTVDDGEISCDEAFNYSSALDLRVKELTDLTGIEAFVNITEIDCSSNTITILDLSSNTALEKITCINNTLTTLILPNTTTLTDVTCYDNALTQLNVSNNTALTRLSFDNNGFVSLDVSNNTALVSLQCNNNALTYIDVSNNTALRFLSCVNNALTSLNLKNGNNTNIASNAVNFLANPNLSCIQVDDEDYANTNWNSRKDGTATYSEDCGDVPCEINIPDTNFKNALLNNHTIDVDNDGIISCDEAASYTGAINVANASITDLTGISAFVGITDLNCNGNALTVLDLTTNAALQTLNCSENDIIRLNVTNSRLLTYISCGGNASLTSINFSNNNVLESLYCENNSLNSLDLTNNTALTVLDCSNNTITSLKLANGNNTNLNTSDSNFTGNSSLNCIEVDDATYADTNWATLKDATASYSENCTQTLSTNDVFSKTVNIYPNPVTTSLTINTLEELQNIEVFNMAGIKVYTDTNTNINLAHLPTGVYIAKIHTTQGKVAVKKLVKE